MEAVHFIGKEIVRFHHYLPAILMALDLPLPKQGLRPRLAPVRRQSSDVQVQRASGRPGDLCDRYGVDAIRYFLLGNSPSAPTVFFFTRSLDRPHHYDRPRILGNLLSRTTAMVQKYFWRLHSRPASGRGSGSRPGAGNLPARALWESMDGFQFSNALAEVWKPIARSKQIYRSDYALGLRQGSDKAPRLAAVLYNLCECHGSSLF